ncbi:ComEA family DNA-binding protein [Algibacter pacificus]|uniref:ComEA family DNA-binding protein n=1 Tax=Algibacter pacificus TaxID=2599389 RepID=UPI0011C8BFDB|nr:helix-hairpin-helix domain-containing protein [Algibacter pacificus]
MNFLKSYLAFSKEQRRGIFLLFAVIIVLQCVYFFILPKFSVNSNKTLPENKKALAVFIAEIDSLKLRELQTLKPKISPFNPNFITDYKGAKLGMSNEEIDKLLQFRKEEQWINSTKQFQEVTQVSDSLLKIISLYFKFPKWITNPEPDKASYSHSYKNKTKTFAQKQDLNTATALQLQKVNGIGEALSNRIVKFRNKFKGGFIADIQLEDVYGLSPEVIQKLKQEFTVKTPPEVQKINLNTATVNQLVTIQHIDYNLAHSIIEQRTLREGFNTLNELLKVKDFPVNKLEIIKLYLQIDNQN